METYLYLSLIPEALIFSQLSPDQFGKYLSIGDKKTSRGHALFFSVDPSIKSDVLKLDAARAKCIAHADGTPRRSSYASIYAALANIPISALGNLYATTTDGITLELQPQQYTPSTNPGLHLYQEISPVNPQVASPLEPEAFARFVTNPQTPICLPRVCFCDLRLNGLATDPERSSADNLPYENVVHLRECLTALKYNPTKMTKIVRREMLSTRLFPVIDKAFYVGDQDHFVSWPLPSEEALESKHYRWWNSATSSHRL